jgi:cytochrome c556
MMRTLSGGFLTLAGVLVWVACSTVQNPPPEQSVQKPAAAANALPASLDAFYPPKANEPAFLIAMFGMTGLMQGALVDLMEQEPENAMKHFVQFKAKYQEVAKMVPEWESRFRIAPVAGLEAAVASGDLGAVMEAFEKLGGVCNSCHMDTWVAVQHRFHWGNFAGIRVTDPASKKELSFLQLMYLLEGSFFGIVIDLEEGQKDKAQKHFAEFQARFEALGESCGECHPTKRHYYVNDEITGMVAKMGEMLKQEQVDRDALMGIGMEIGEKSCGKCHRVHLPAAIGQRKARN